MRGALLALCGLALFAQPARPLPGDLVPFQATFKEVAGPRWLWRASQARAESGFNPFAKSPVGASGLTQFMPGTWKDQQKRGRVPKDAHPTDPHWAIVAQNCYMTDLEDFARKRGMGTERGILDAAHGSYNAGPGSFQRALRVAQSMGLLSRPGTEDAWLQALPVVTRHHAVETTGYIARINGFHAEYLRRAK